MNTAFITGVSTGLGNALCRSLLASGAKVYALGRTAPDINDENLRFLPVDLSNIGSIAGSLKELLSDVPKLDVAFLNAGALSRMARMEDCPVEEIQGIMTVNVWSNKVLLDELLKKPVQQVVAISSGASISGSEGWNSYSLSKATLNMLMKLYASEHPNCHFTPLAPGLVLTPMLRSLLEEESSEAFPSLKRLHQSDKQTPEEAANNILSLLAQLKALPNGEFQDVRKLLNREAF